MNSQFLKTVWSFTVMTLMIIGIGGLVYNTLRGGGWLQRTLGVVWDAGLRHPVVIVPLVLISIFIAWLTLNGKIAGGKSNPGADMFVLGLAAIGGYVVYDWLMN
jgi:hypothetical protein